MPLLQGFAKLAGGRPHEFLEGLTEIHRGVEAAIRTDLCDGFFCAFQKVAGLPDLDVIDIFNQGQARCGLEGMAEMVFRHIQLGGDFTDAVYGIIVLVDVAQNQRQLLLLLRQLDGTVGVLVPVQYG